MTTMRVLLLAGLGPYFKSRDDLTGSLFDEDSVESLRATYRDHGQRCVDLAELHFHDRDGQRIPLLRRERSGSLSLVLGGTTPTRRPPVPNLVGSTLQAILTAAGIDHEYRLLDVVWRGELADEPAEFDVVLLSTTFICDRRSLATAIGAIAERYPAARIVVGGQFSNLKYEAILRRHPEVTCVVRGDAERALPLLLRALAAGEPLDVVPNLAFREGGEVRTTGFEYIDLEEHPSPTFSGHVPVVPYESMRGCPYRCKFCSFPAASPQWRYKSAPKIVEDWARYRDENGAFHIRALDSTFTVPPRRFDELLSLLPAVGIGWEAFTRANSIHSPAIVEALAEAGCRTLSIGFESMSDNSLDHMNKKVSATQNERAFRLLRGSPVGYRISFMVGYPGETPDDYTDTHDFLVGEYAGHFQLYVFSLQDETMPVWEDVDRFDLRVVDADDPDSAWSHRGMDVGTARELRAETLREVRWGNDDAVALLWQPEYQTPLLPSRGSADNYRVEKLVERLALLPVDEPSPARGIPRMRGLLDELRTLGVHDGDLGGSS